GRRGLEFRRFALSAADIVGGLYPCRDRHPVVRPPASAGRGQSLGRADPGRGLHPVWRLSRPHRAPPAHALRAGPRHAVRRRTGRVDRRMESAGSSEAQLLLDQARPLRRLDATGDRLGRRTHREGRFCAGRLLRYCRTGGAGGRDQSSRPQPRDARQFAVDGHFGGGSGRDGMTELLRVDNLTVEFGVHEGVLRAVDNVSFSIPPGGTLALVGESGSGKSVCSQAIMGLLPRTATITQGSILFNDPRDKDPAVAIAKLDRQGPEMREIRGGEISIIFQEPMTSLSALHTVGDQIGEAVELHGGTDTRLSSIHSLGDQLQEAIGRSRNKLTKPEIAELTRDMLRMVGFPDPKRALRTYPFELSGGLRQRAMIAMALVCRPALLIADEPTTALDVTIQAQILKLMSDLKSELGMAMLMITHDLGVVANMADEVVVMYHGQVKESATAEALFTRPQHPYLTALLKAVPRFGMKPGEKLTPIREIKSKPTGMFAEANHPQSGAETGTMMLQIDALSKGYRIRKSGWLGGGGEAYIQAVSDVGFEVKRGECLGLVGESGCGKTTLSKLIMRAIDPDSGTIRFNDH